MAQDIRKLFKEEPKVFNDKMPEGHEARFMQKLDNELPVDEKPTTSLFSFLNIAASVVILIGLSIGAYQLLGSGEVDPNNIQQVNTETESPLGKLSPQLKKVEDYYLASINLELSKMKVTPENKELFDGYLTRLNELNKEYEVLSMELTESGPSERTVNALIENLKLRLNLMYRLKEKMSELNNESKEFDENQA